MTVPNVNCICAGFFWASDKNNLLYLTKTSGEIYTYERPATYKGVIFITLGGENVLEPPDDDKLQEAVRDTCASGIIYDMEGWLSPTFVPPTPSPSPSPPTPLPSPSTSDSTWESKCKKYIQMFPDILHIACPVGHGRSPNSPQIIYPSDIGFTHIAPMAYASTDSYNDNVGGWNLSGVKNVYKTTHSDDGWPTNKTFLTFHSESMANISKNPNALSIKNWLIQQKSDYAGILGWGSTRLHYSTEDNRNSGKMLLF